MLHVFKTSPGSHGVHSISNYVNQGKGRKKCDRPIVHDYLKKNKFIDATFEKICPHCVYPQVSAVKKWERHVRFIHSSSSNNQLFLLNELICWLILGDSTFICHFSLKNVIFIFLSKQLFGFFTKFNNETVNVNLQFWFGVVSEQQNSKNII